MRIHNNPQLSIQMSRQNHIPDLLIKINSIIVKELIEKIKEKDANK